MVPLCICGLASRYYEFEVGAEIHGVEVLPRQIHVGVNS
jgi:hypothetical protein